MPEQQPDKQCGTCKHWEPYRMKLGTCLLFGKQTARSYACSWWTPKPPKNPEEK